MIVAVLDIVLHEDAGDAYFFKWLVEVVLDVRSNDFFNMFDKEVVIGDVERLVRDLGCLAVQPEG